MSWMLSAAKKEKADIGHLLLGQRSFAVKQIVVSARKLA